ncbi:hypothetical protein ACOSP7_007009 [Xanthoceras sorbifolium]
MKNQPAIKLLLWSYLTFASLPDHGWGARCSNNAPTLQQTQVGFGNPPKFIAQVQNNCPVCPIINIHMKCGSFSQALVNPRLLKVLAYNDCVVNAGLPLAPLESFSFNYTHHKYPMQLATWFFQCE